MTERAYKNASAPKEADAIFIIQLFCVEIDTVAAVPCAIRTNGDISNGHNGIYAVSLGKAGVTCGSDNITAVIIK